MKANDDAVATMGAKNHTESAHVADMMAAGRGRQILCRGALYPLSWPPVDGLFYGVPTRSYEET